MCFNEGDNKKCIQVIHTFQICKLDEFFYFNINLETFSLKTKNNNLRKLIANINSSTSI